MNRTFSVSQLGRMGRYGNSIFQYMFAKTYARRFDLQVECPRWIGNVLFGTRDLPVTHQFPVFHEKDNHGRDDALIPKMVEPLVQRDIHGWFQYHTSYYAPDQDYLRSLFQPIPKLRARLEAGWERIAARGKTAVGIHIRRGDYGQECFYLTPVEWYLQWLEKIWPTLDEPFLYLASDDLPLVSGALAKYKPATIHDFLPKVSIRKAEFFPDWYALTRCRHLAIPNSTFSFSAALYAEPGVGCFRSSLSDRGFVPIDPWDELPLLTGAEARVENYPDIPGLTVPLYQPQKKGPLRLMIRGLLGRP